MKKRTLFLFGLLFLLFIYVPLQAQWVNDPAVNTAIFDADSTVTKVESTATSDGKIFVAWWYCTNTSTDNNSTLYLQLLNPNGEKLWPGRGIIISTHMQLPSPQNLLLACDKNDNAIVIFSDRRLEPSYTKNFYAYKIDASGNFLWGSEGVRITTAMPGMIPYYDLPNYCNLCITSNNNVVFTTEYAEDSQYAKILCQKINSDGTLAWGGADDGVLLQCDTANLIQPQVVPSDNEGVLLAFEKVSGEFPDQNIHICAQKVNAEGEQVFANDKVITNARGISTDDYFSACRGGNDGMLVSWRDDRNNNTLFNIYAQYLTADGTLLWQENGTQLCFTEQTASFTPVATGTDNEQNSYVVWIKGNDTQMERCLCIQKIAEDGSLLWSNDGKEITPWSSTIGDISNQLVTTITNDTIIILFFNYLDDTYMNLSYNVYGVLANGNALWNGNAIDITTSLSWKSNVSLSPVSNRQVIAVWINDMIAGGAHPSTINDVMGQNLNMDGTLGINSVGIIEPSSSQDFIVWPNPVHHRIYFSESIENYMLVNSKGMTVKTFSGKPVQEISLDDLSAGIYFLKYQTVNNPYKCTRIVKLGN